MTTSGSPPSLPLHVAVLMADALGVVVVLTAAVLLSPAVGASAWFPLKSAAIFSIIMLVVLARIRGSHPFGRFGPANQVTTLRATLVSLVAGLVGEPVGEAAGTFIFATSIAVTVLDGVDGWLARRSRLASAFGARFDMEVDALFILALATAAWQLGRAGVWIVMAGLLRYLFVAAGWMAPRLAAPLPPSRRRQTVCVVQIFGLSVVVLPGLTPPATAWLAAGLLAALAASFAIDVVWLWRR